MRIAVLASNFSGNIGDLYILRAVTDFIVKKSPEAKLEVFPRPRLFDRRVACAEQIHLSENVNVVPHRFALLSIVEHWSRKYPTLERLMARAYLTPFGRLFRAKSQPLDPDDYDAIVSVGGEMHTPYSFLDIYDYKKNLNAEGITPFVVGPISLKPDPHYIAFLKNIFAGLECVGIRDPKTFSFLEKHGFSNIKLVPDCAFLSWNGPAENRLHRKKIGLCLHTKWAGNFKQACRIVEQSISASQRLERELVLFPTHTVEDYQLYCRLVSMYRNTQGITFAFPNTSDDFITLSQSLDLIISDRLHALLVGLINGANILPIKTRHKVIGYCDYLNLENTINPNDSAQVIYENIISCAQDQALSAKLESFCAESYNNVSEFYANQLFPKNNKTNN